MRADAAEIVEAYRSGLTFVKIQIKFKCSPYMITYLRKLYGVPPRARVSQYQIPRYGKGISGFLSEWEIAARNRTIKNRYKENVPANYIAEEVKVSTRTVIRIMRKLGLPPRKNKDVDQRRF